MLQYIYILCRHPFIRINHCMSSRTPIKGATEDFSSLANANGSFLIKEFTEIAKDSIQNGQSEFLGDIIGKVANTLHDDKGAQNVRHQYLNDTQFIKFYKSDGRHRTRGNITVLDADTDTDNDVDEQRKLNGDDRDQMEIGVYKKGSKQKRRDADTRQGSTMNFLRTFLRKIKMDDYYGAFKEKGLDSKNKLSDINEKTLDELQIRSQSHRATILKAVSNL
eukprot:635775_1